MTQHHCNTHVYCRCVRYDDGWKADGCHVVNNLLLGVDQHVDCSCQQVAVSYAVLIDMPRPPSTVGYTVWFHVCCFFCIASFTIDLLLCISLSGCMVLGDWPKLPDKTPTTVEHRSLRVPAGPEKSWKWRKKNPALKGPEFGHSSWRSPEKVLIFGQSGPEKSHQPARQSAMH